MIPRRYRRFAIDIARSEAAPRLLDISLGGLRAHAGAALRMDEVIDINLATPDGPLRLRGRIVRARRSGADDRPWEYGIEFVDVADTDRSRLERFIQAQAEDELDDTQNKRLTSEIDRLKRRTQELEHKLDDQKRATQTLRHQLQDGARPAPAGPTRDRAERITDFGRVDFRSLLDLGQPLQALVDHPDPISDDVGGRVAALLQGRFDLPQLADRGQRIDRDELADLLFGYYRQKLVDFA